MNCVQKLCNVAVCFGVSLLSVFGQQVSVSPSEIPTGQRAVIRVTASEAKLLANCPEVWIKQRGKPIEFAMRAGKLNQSIGSVLFAAMVPPGQEGLYDIYCSSGRPQAQDISVGVLTAALQPVSSRVVRTEPVRDPRVTQVLRRVAAAERRLKDHEEKLQTALDTVQENLSRQAQEVKGLEGKLTQSQQETKQQLLTVAESAQQLKTQTSALASDYSRLDALVTQLRSELGQTNKTLGQTNTHLVRTSRAAVQSLKAVSHLGRQKRLRWWPPLTRKPHLDPSLTRELDDAATRLEVDAGQLEQTTGVRKTAMR